jgi:hypothetical protein
MSSMRKVLLYGLATAGAAALLFVAAVAAQRVARNHAPDRLVELVSPDRNYRIVITEELAGFPGAYCIKQAYVLRAGAALDRNDEDDEVFAGGCQGLVDLRWEGARVRGAVSLSGAVDGVNALRLREHAAGGAVRVAWSGR